MKIIMKNNRTIKRFEDVAVGEVFGEEIDGRLMVQMRIFDVKDADGYIYRAVDLTSGELYEMDDTDPAYLHYIILVQSELDRDDVFDFLHFFSAESPAQLTSLQDFPRQKSELVCQGIAAFGESLGKDLNLYRQAAVDI